MSFGMSPNAITAPLWSCVRMCMPSRNTVSLFAVVLAIGIVVDDAIVVLENISRYVEEGMRPMEAAFKGAGEIGFTIVSISVSLIAVLIPLLLMGGIIGRLFREFAVVLSMTIAVSAFVSLTLTPMMASRLLKAHDAERHGRLYRMSEAAFDWLLVVYADALDVALVYAVNASQVPDKLDVLPLSGPGTTATQPYAVGRDSDYAQLMQQLLQSLQSPASQERFTHSGFRWKTPEPKP